MTISSPAPTWPPVGGSRPAAPYTPSTIADIWLMLTTTFTSDGGDEDRPGEPRANVRANHLEHAASAGEHADARRGIERDHDHRHDVERAPQQIESEPRAGQQTRGDRAGADHAGRRQRRRTDQTRERRRQAAVASASAPADVCPGCAIVVEVIASSLSDSASRRPRRGRDRARSRMRATRGRSRRRPGPEVFPTSRPECVR